MERYGWLAYATRDSRSFMRDEVQLFIAHKTKEGIRPAEPIDIIKFGDLVPSGLDFTGEVKPTIWPMDFCEVLYNALSAPVFGVTDLPAEVRRLKSALAKSEARVDKLIAGIGRLGGEEQ